MDYKSSKRVEVNETTWCEITPVQRIDGRPTETQLSISTRDHCGIYVGRINHVKELVKALNEAIILMESEEQS